MNIAIVGSREGVSKETVFNELDRVYNSFKAKPSNHVFSIISGGAKGVDTYAKEWMEKRTNFDSSCFKIIRPINPKDKFSYLLRNVEIITMSNGILAFWNGKSKGTKFVIDYARARNKIIKVIPAVKD